MAANLVRLSKGVRECFSGHLAMQNAVVVEEAGAGG